MSQNERYGTRDLTYSRWHRRNSTERFLGWERATHLTYIDLDGIEYCWICREPLVLKELAQDVGQSRKATTVMRKLAQKAGIPAILVFYATNEIGDIERFRVRTVSPRWGEERVMTPQEYAGMLWGFRQEHLARCHPDYNTESFRLTRQHA